MINVFRLNYSLADHLYVGCYFSPSVTVLASTTPPVSSVLICRNNCNGYFYFGYTMVSGVRTCLCLAADTFIIEKATQTYASNLCGVPCTGDANLCGNSNFVSVYRIAGCMIVF
jgi:hypothetical protein